MPCGFGPAGQTDALDKLAAHGSAPPGVGTTEHRTHLAAQDPDSLSLPATFDITIQASGTDAGEPPLR